MKRFANISNGLAYPHDDVCNFMSTHGHNCKMGYFRLDSMPWGAVIELINNRPITIVDASPHGKEITDGLRYGLTSWLLMYNRALGYRVQVAPWQTREMYLASGLKKWHPLRARIRRLVKIYHVAPRPVVIGDLVHLDCHSHFAFDDKPEMILATPLMWNMGG